jgi:hypothetical protein
LQFEGRLAGELSMEMPPAKPLMLKALSEKLPVYERELQALGKPAIKWSPPLPAKFLETLGPPIEPGLHQIRWAIVLSGVQ